MGTRQRLARADGEGYDSRRRLTRIGNSVGLTISPELLDELNAMEGDEVGIVLNEEKECLEIEFPLR
jgi:hypothetical protein